MNTRVLTQTKPAAKGVIPPVRSNLVLQRRATDRDPVAAVPPIVHEVLNSPGQPLDTATRAFMEPRFGHDFSQVRVHADAKAADSAEAVNSLAYTVGQQVVFGEGRYTPHSSQGMQLLAHELTHTIQQSAFGSAAVPRHQPISIEPPGTGFEQSAEERSTRLTNGSGALTSTHGIALQRQPAPAAKPKKAKVTPILGPDPAALSKTQPPTAAWISKQRQTVDGKQVPDPERMRVGELLIVRVGLEHVGLAAVRSMGSMFVTDALTKESLTVEETGHGVVIQINFRATKIGAEHAEMWFHPAGTAADGIAVPVETHIEMSQEAFRGQLQEASEYKNNAYHAANLYMHKVSPPYREGWENVKKTLEKAGEGNPVDEIVVHLAMTFIAGLAGGRVAEVMEHLKKGIPLTEGMKELTIHATETGLHILKPMTKASIPAPQDPADWVDAGLQQIETEELAVGSMLEDMIKANNDSRAGFFRDIDVVAAVHNALTFNGQPMRSLATVPIPKAEEFEKEIWKGWLGAYRGHPDIYDADAWLVITGRLEDLGENSWEFLKTYMR